MDEVIVKGKSKSVKIYEPLETTSENEQLKETYEEAFTLYQRGDFKEAMKIWKTLDQDKTSQMMMERISELKGKEKWNGVWEWKEK